MAAIPFPVHVVTDDAGAIVAGATVTIASVKDKDDADVASHGATVSLSGANVCVNYDAATKGEAWVTLSVSKSGSTFTGFNASPRAFLTADAQKVAPLTSTVAGTVNVNATYIADTLADPPDADAPLTLAQLVALLPPIDGGAVSASPTPSATAFTATGSELHAATGGYSPAASPQRVFFTSGANRGLIRAIVATTGHVKTGSNHAFTTAAFPAAPGAGDTFIVI